MKRIESGCECKFVIITNWYLTCRLTLIIFAVQNTLTMEASLSAAQESYKRARNDFAAGLCEEQQKLLRQV
jgi:hypothetical protein